MSGCYRFPGSYCQFGKWLDIEDGTLQRHLSPIPMACYAPALPPSTDSLALDPITGTGLLLIVPGLGSRAAAVAADMNQGMQDAGITTKLGQAIFIAQVAHESANFTKLFEDGGKTVYNTKTKARSSYKEWKKNHPKQDTAEKDADEQVYDYFFFMYDKDSPDEGRQKVAKTLGNINAGDGKRYRGRGYIQLTGRSNYKAAGKALGLDLEGNPDLAAEPANAARIAGWFWKSKGLNKYTQIDNTKSFKAVTLRINGGYNGLPDRTALFNRAKSALGLTKIPVSNTPKPAPVRMEPLL